MHLQCQAVDGPTLNINGCIMDVYITIYPHGVDFSESQGLGASFRLKEALALSVPTKKPTEAPKQSKAQGRERIAPVPGRLLDVLCQVPLPLSLWDLAPVSACLASCILG